MQQTGNSSSPWFIPRVKCIQQRKVITVPDMMKTIKACVTILILTQLHAVSSATAPDTGNIWNLTISPAILIPGSRSQDAVTMRCTPVVDVTPMESLNYLAIVRWTRGRNIQEVVGGLRLIGANTQFLVRSKDITGVKVTGNLLKNWIQVILVEAGCADQGSYACKADYFRFGGQRILSTSPARNFTVQEGPGRPHLTVVPPIEMQTAGGDMLLICNASTGGPGIGNETAWKWEFKDAQTRGWVDVTGAEQSDRRPVARACGQRAVSTLRVHVRLADQGRDYRCSFSKGGAEVAPPADPYAALLVYQEMSSVKGHDHLPKITSAGIDVLGSRRTLVCDVTAWSDGKQDLRMSWSKQPSGRSNLNVTSTSVTRVNVTESPATEKQNTFRLSSTVTFTVQISDHFEYFVCTLSGEQFKVAAMYQVSVLKPPDSVEVRGPTLVKEGERHMWTCETDGALGEKAPEIQWQLPDDSLLWRAERDVVQEYPVGNLHGFKVSGTLDLFVSLTTSPFDVVCVSYFAPTNSTLTQNFSVTVIEKDECASQPCQNGATCEDEVNGYTCRCTRQFRGAQCERKEKPCDRAPCRNGAACTNLEDGYHCECLKGYQGHDCETETDECSSEPCENRGTCQDLLDGYECACPVKFEGAQCETEIETCQDDPCRNGSTCVELDKGYHCQCAPGYNGPRCENDIDDCINHTCQEGATCEDKVNGYTCLCDPGHAGDDCRTNASLADDKKGLCASDPCLHDGKCVDIVNGYTCTCTQGFVGWHCETEQAECGSAPCYHGARCVDLSNSYQCLCPRGYLGPRCETDVRVKIYFRPWPVYAYKPEAKVQVYCCPPPTLAPGRVSNLTIEREVTEKSASANSSSARDSGQSPAAGTVVATVNRTVSSDDVGLVENYAANATAALEMSTGCLVLTLWAASCGDEGGYRCTARYRESEGQATLYQDHASAVLNITLLPGFVAMELVQPRNKELLMPGTAMTLSCTDILPLTYTKPVWKWEVKRPRGINGTRGWLPYTPRDNITVSVTQPVDDCRQRHSSNLTHVIRYPDDDGMRVRCYVTQHGVGDVRMTGLYVVDIVLQAKGRTLLAGQSQLLRRRYDWRLLTVALTLVATLAVAVGTAVTRRLLEHRRRAAARRTSTQPDFAIPSSSEA